LGEVRKRNARACRKIARKSIRNPMIVGNRIAESRYVFAEILKSGTLVVSAINFKLFLKKKEARIRRIQRAKISCTNIEKSCETNSTFSRRTAMKADESIRKGKRNIEAVRKSLKI
jgi:hypothetical protein